MKKLALALLLILAVAGGIYYFFYWAPSRARGPLPELVALAPAEAEWLVYIDMDAWRDSSIPGQLHKFLPGVTEDAEYREFVQATGFDYARDLDRAALALLPVSDSVVRSEATYQAIVFAEGRFDRDKITRHALKHGSKELQEPVELILVSSSRSESSTGGKGGQALFAFLSDERVAIADVPAGDASQLQRGRDALLAAARTDPQQDPRPATAERATRVAGAPFFAVGRAEALQPLRSRLSALSPLAGQVANVLANVRWLTIAARPEQDQIRVSILGECDSVVKASQLGLLLDGLLLFSRAALDDPKTRNSMSREQAEQIDRVLATARVSREQSTVEIRLEIPIRLLAGAPGKS